MQPRARSKLKASFFLSLIRPSFPEEARTHTDTMVCPTALDAFESWSRSISQKKSVPKSSSTFVAIKPWRSAKFRNSFSPLVPTRCENDLRFPCKAATPTFPDPVLVANPVQVETSAQRRQRILGQLLRSQEARPSSCDLSRVPIFST